MSDITKMQTLINMLPQSSQERVLKDLKQAIHKELSAVVGALGLKLIEKDQSAKQLTIEAKANPINAKKDKKKRTKYRTDWKVHGRNFPTAKKLCEFYGITNAKLNYHLHKKGEELEDFLPIVDSKTMIKRKDKNGEQAYLAN